MCIRDRLSIITLSSMILTKTKYTPEQTLMDMILCIVSIPTESGPIGFLDVMTPAGMTRERKEYLFKNIRTFCKEEYKDLLCPEVGPEPDQPGPIAEPTKKRRKRSV